MNLRQRARMRPALYPAAILLAFVLKLMVEWGIDPWAAGRALAAALMLGLVMPWLVGLVVGDRDVAGVVSMVAVLVLLGGRLPGAQALLAAAVLAVVLITLLALRRAETRASLSRLMPKVSRVLAASAAVLLVAVAVGAFQSGRVVPIARDFVAGLPLHPSAEAAESATDAPDVYLLLLDGYPRSDKLSELFGIDDSAFLEGLTDRGFFVASHSRSNYTTTNLTLASMLNDTSLADAGTAPDLRELVNHGTVLDAYRAQGYEVTAISPGFEGVALRRADRFIDSGQPNEFEWNLVLLTGVAPLLDVLAPTFMADTHRARVIAALDTVRSIAASPSARPRLVLAHVIAPHAPLAFGAGGEAVDIRGAWIPYDVRTEYDLLGPEEYQRRLSGQIEYLDGAVLDVLDSLIASDPRAVVTVFSDHGSGIHDGPALGVVTDVDLKSANLLAVRSPGREHIIDDRSTLVNLLPRILRSYTGRSEPDLPETVYQHLESGEFVPFERPD